MTNPCLTVSYICFLLVLLGATSANTCEVPSWPSNLGENPVTTARGKVLLVALVKGYCGYCVRQAEDLERLKSHLAGHGFPDVEMILVNGGELRSRNKIQNFQNAVNLTVLQDTENHTMFRQVFNGSKDDFIVYDRCGQRSFFIPHPYSYIGYQIVERIIRATHEGRQSCHCNLDNAANNVDPHNQMMGDQPRGPSYSIANMGDELNGPSYSIDSTDEELNGPSYSIDSTGEEPNGPSYSVVDTSAQNALGCENGDICCRGYERNLANNPHHGRLVGLGQQEDSDSMEQPLFHVPFLRRGRNWLCMRGHTGPFGNHRGHRGFGHSMRVGGAHGVHGSRGTQRNGPHFHGPRGRGPHGNGRRGHRQYGHQGHHGHHGHHGRGQRGNGHDQRGNGHDQRGFGHGHGHGRYGISNN